MSGAVVAAAVAEEVAAFVKYLYRERERRERDTKGEAGLCTAMMNKQ